MALRTLPFTNLKKKNYFRNEVEKLSVESADYAICDSLNPIFLDGELQLLFNQFLWVLCIAMWLCVKERDSINGDSAEHLVTMQSFPIWGNAYAIK